MRCIVHMAKSMAFQGRDKRASEQLLRPVFIAREKKMAVATP